jgi:hypothetical protein
MKLIAEGQIKPCCVSMEKLKGPSQAIEENTKDKQSDFYKCYFCPYTKKAFSMLNIHIKAKHPHETYFNCDYVDCLHLFFPSQEAKKIHMEKQHTKNSDGQKVRRCVYCENTL